MLAAVFSEQDCFKLVPGADERTADSAATGEAIGFTAHIDFKDVRFFLP